jgi:hypothetical protein
VWAAALLSARYGTTRARVLATVAMVASAGLAFAWRARERRRLSDPAHVVTRLAGPIDRTVADKALRALSLVGDDGEVRSGETSSDLARLHVERALAALPVDRIAARAARVAALVGGVALVVGAGAIALVLAYGWSVLEGADVLLARAKTAPVAMRWLDGVDLVARPPDYVHEDEIRESDPGPLLLPYGTVLTLHGFPVRAGRALRLSDGTTEVPFVDDGSGGLVARWSLAGSCRLRVLARFGDVSIPEAQTLSVTSIPDRAPFVSLEGAPRSVTLADEKEDIPIRYEATDDHGLREVDLVLRAGVREDRRVLGRLDGDVRTEGGHTLRLRDDFLRKSHVPVEITVEAKDNDPLSGPKWGVSAAITVVPPAVGEPEARGLEALRALRDAVVDTLAARLEHGVPADAAGKRALLAEDLARANHDEDLLWQATGASYAGVRAPSRSRVLLGAQAARVREAVAKETRALSAATRAALVKATERFALVVDAVVRGLGVRDARDAAKTLSEAAEDLAGGANEAQGGDEAARARAASRMDAAVSVLAAGSGQLARLGSTGEDLGEIVDADLLRVRRARDVRDLVHAELAARDLAERLSRPDPSFGNPSSRGPHSGGGESGGARGTPDEDAEPADEVERAYNQAAADLEELAQEHAGEIGKMEQALSAAAHDEQGPPPDEAKRHAAAVRDAVRSLPQVGSGSDSWTSKGAASRELAEQMARSLETGRLDEAVQSAGSSIGALEEAKRTLQTGGWLQDPGGAASGRVDDARRKLEAERAWTSAQLEQLRRRVSERARNQLSEGGQEEGKLGERARSLSEREKARGSLPMEAIDSIDDAARAAREAADALERGDADEGMKHQREAQRDLEAAGEQLRGEEGSDEGGQGSLANEPVSIPEGGKHKGPTEFRRRVVEGLARPGAGALKDAVRRYAEGLLR